MKRIFLAAVALAAGCSDALEQTSSAGQVIAVVNSTDNTASFVLAADFSVVTVDLQMPGGAATSAAGRASTVLVPLGPADAVAAVRTPGYCTTGLCARPVVVIPLAPGSGATGVAIQDDSIAWVANPSHDRVTRINYVTGDTSASIIVGSTPRAVAIVRGVVYVINANLSGGTPAGSSSISWFVARGARPTQLPTIPLTGTNAEFGVVGDDSLLYVVDRGTPGAGDGKLSIVDPMAKQEIVVLNGLGESPGPAAYHPSGLLLVASATDGILEVNALARSVTRGPGQGVKPGGHGVSGLAVDQRGRIYALDPGACAAAGTVHVLSPPPDYGELRSVSVGTCPAAAAVATTP